jgi:hypothetical protein
MRVWVMGLAGGRRELLVSATFTALLVACILLLLTGAGPKTRRARAARRAQGPARPGRAPTHLVYEPPSSSATGHGGARELRGRPWRRASSSATVHGGARELRGRPWRRARAPPLPLCGAWQREKGEREEEDD